MNEWSIEEFVQLGEMMGLSEYKEDLTSATTSEAGSWGTGEPGPQGKRGLNVTEYSFFSNV